MTQLKEVYKCSVCGNIVELIHEGAGELVCCGKPMELLKEQNIEQGREKHVPVIEETSNGYRVTVNHPMESEHFIEWIELIADRTVCRKHLKPGDEPVAEFCVKASSVKARELCSIHGLWRS